jgi:hypothetical protein
VEVMAAEDFTVEEASTAAVDFAARGLALV